MTSSTLGTLRFLFVEGTRLLSAQLEPVTEAQWSLPTPCAEWTLRVLTRHVTETALGAAAIITARRRNDASGGLPVDAWTDASDALLMSLDERPLDDRWPLPDDSADRRLIFYACDFVTHAWDVSVALQREIDVPTPVLDVMEPFFHALPAEVLRKPGAFADPVETRQGESRTRSLMHFLGRGTAADGSGWGEHPSVGVPSRQELRPDR